MSFGRQSNGNQSAGLARRLLATCLPESWHTPFRSGGHKDDSTTPETAQTSHSHSYLNRTEKQSKSEPQRGEWLVYERE